MSKRILIVDDDQYLRDLYEEVLKDEGYEVEIAVDGKDGLEKMQKGGYDVVLLDVMMPKLDGIMVLDKLTKDPPKMPNKSVILLTNLSHDPIIQEALKKGATSFIIKADMTPDQMVKKVKENLA